MDTPLTFGLTSSEFSERLAYGALIDGRWRRHIKGLRQRLAKAHETAASRLLKIGFEIFSEPKAGIFLWARPFVQPGPAAQRLNAIQS